MPHSPEDKTTFRRRLRLRLHRQLRLLTLWPLAVVAALILTLLGLGAYVINSAQWVDRTHEVLAKISQVETLVQGMESDVRGYRITGDRSFLEPFERALAAFPAHLDALEMLVRDEPRQLTELRQLRESHRAWNGFAAQVLERVAAQLPMDGPLQLGGKTLMDAVRTHIGALQQHEQGLLRERSDARARARVVTIAGVLIAALVFAPLLVMSIRRTFAHLDTSYRAVWDETDRERERLDVTLSSIGDAVIATDAQGAVAYLNPVAVALTGWAMEEARGKPIETVFNIVNETTRATVESPVTQVLRDGTVVGLTHHTLLLTKDGREIPIADSAAPIRDNAGQITGVVMVFRDQTEERETETRLRESEARKAAILNSSLDAIVGMDARGLIVEFNPAAETMFGHRADEVLGRPLAEIIIPERLRAAHNCGLAHYLATGEGPVLSRRIELPALRADGTEFPVEISIHRIAGIEPPRFSGFIRDITVRKLAEEEVAEKARLLNLTSDAILIRDVEGRIVYWNEGAEKLYGWSREEALGKRSHDLLKTEFPKPFEEITEELYRTNHWTGEFVHTTRDGRRITVLARKALDRDSQGNPAGILQSLTDITGRKREEEALSRIAAIIESSNDAILSKDLYGVLTSWNASAERIFGYTAQEAIGQPVTMLIPPGHLDEEPSILARIRNGERIERYETVRRRKDGTLIDVSLTVSPVRDSLGRIVGASKIVRDITERKRADEELRESEERFRTMANSMPQLAWTARADGYIFWYNQRWYDYTGTTPEQMEGWGWQSVPDAAELPKVLERWKASIATGDPFEMTFPLRGADGIFRPFLTRVIPLKNAAGRVVQWFGTNTDVNELKRAEEAVRAAGERFRFMAESLPQKIFTAEPSGDCDYFNRQWIEFTGTTPEQLHGRGWLQFVHPDDLEETMRCWNHSIETGEHFEVEHRFRRHDGEYRWNVSRAHAMRGADGQITMWIGSNTDIDDMMRAQEELIEAEAQLADRAVQLETLVDERTSKLRASQEKTRALNEALTLGSLHQLEMIETAEALNEQLRAEIAERKRLEAEVASAVEDERKRIGQELHDGLVQELTGIGMMLHVLGQNLMQSSPALAHEARRLVLMMETAQENARNQAKSFYPVELEQHGLVVALTAFALRTEQKFSVSCRVQPGPHTPVPVSDDTAVQLFRIAQEAVHNAAKHAQAREIIISLSQQNNGWLLTVKDNGVGLPGDAHAASGMGLRIMRYRSRMIGGTLDVCNNNGGGVLVSCTVPAVDGTEPEGGQ